MSLLFRKSKMSKAQKVVEKKLLWNSSLLTNFSCSILYLPTSWPAINRGWSIQQ